MSQQSAGFHALMYHEVAPASLLPALGRHIDVPPAYDDVLPRRLFVSTEDFALQMVWLADHGFTTITLDETRDFVCHGKPLPERSVLITFDDLYQSVKRNAYPVLRNLGFHAVGFVVHDWVYAQPSPADDTLSRTLSWPELESMKDVFEYANHSAGLHTRSASGTALEQASREVFLEDLRRGSARLDHPDVYAYPFGVATEDSDRWLEEAGTALAFTTDPGYNNAKTPALRLRRHGVFEGASLEALLSDA